MWFPALADVCAQHPDLVAVHESPAGILALVLRQTIVPLSEERTAWLAETRTVARDVIHDLRDAGFTGRSLVAQWLSPPRLGQTLETWPCRWQGDPGRAAEVRAVVRRALADRRFLAQGRARQRQRAGGVLETESIHRWYCTMAPTWLAIRPETRRQLVLQTHGWIVERALDHETWPPPEADLAADGALAHRLERLVPADDRGRWQPWIGAVRADLARVLARAPECRDERWLRRLFLVAWRVPAPEVAKGASVRAL